ncbi:MAG TPA: ABC transporter substrate-binding protein [Streptosporangiaceae bacterium]|jgi:NitT/TauT family transport system substrate-binding protein
MKRWAFAAIGVLALAGCTVAGATTSGGGSTVQVVIGYQSETINTVTAGTLLKTLGYFERDLAALGRKTGKKYSVSWQNYSTGAPITAQMLAGNIDIGSMGDYPLLINGSRSQSLTGDRTEMVSVTGYNLRGALNGIVVARNSKVTTLRQLNGQTISTSVGSAGDGTMVQALARAGIDPATGVKVSNQDPSVGASALQAGSVAALAQFVDWPGLLVYKGQARLLYDGGSLDVPTLHGVVVRQGFAQQQPDVVRTFLQAQLQATSYLHQHPLAAAELVGKAAGLPPQVVYLYNGPNGVATFSMAINPQLRTALGHDIPFLKSIGVLTSTSLNLNSFINTSYLKQVLGAGYNADLATTANPAAIAGTDTVCHQNVGNPATAGEVWLAGQNYTHPVATPDCLLRNIKADEAAGHTVQAAYIPDAITGTRWFADQDIWVRSGSQFEPFATQSSANIYLATHPGSHVISYAAAVAAS